MSFYVINKTLSLSNLKTRTTMNAKISVFVICVETIINLLLFNLNDCTFKGFEYITWFFKQFIVSFSVIRQCKTFQIMLFHRANAWLRLSSFTVHLLLNSFDVLLNNPLIFALLFGITETITTDSRLPKNFFICFNESPSKMMKNAFHYILQALFVLKILKFLSWLFGHAEKTASLER